MVFAVYPASSITDLSAVDSTLKAMELQVQQIKERLREETEAIPKAKVIYTFPLYLTKGLHLQQIRVLRLWFCLYLYTALPEIKSMLFFFETSLIKGAFFFNLWSLNTEIAELNLLKMCLILALNAE